MESFNVHRTRSENNLEQGVTYDDLPDGACFRRPPLKPSHCPATRISSPLSTPVPSPLSTPTPTPGHTRPNTPGLSGVYSTATSGTYKVEEPRCTNTTVPYSTYYSEAHGESLSDEIVTGPFMTPTVIPPTSVVAIVEVSIFIFFI
ncbi:hypothetical protein SK128_002737 [Halocaridina rubra]|uniref:Uncharacterized protein n=1 Tax=Halocaridina rubra TaxID=373956 RepID=A0AAN8WJ46_HALRR